MKSSHFGLVLLSSIALAGSAEPPRAAQAPEGVEIIHDVEIGKGGDRTLHAEIARPKSPSSTPMPAILWIHGGGWSAGSHKGNPAMWFATQGYFTASIEYRLSGEAKWPAQIEDCKLGVRWLRANAAKYNVDPNRIGCWGSSAGGHFVACLGTMSDRKEFEGHGGYEGISSQVQAVVDYCGPADMTRGSAGIQGATDKDAPAPLGLFGASFAEKPDVWKEGSPVVYVKSGQPPFLIVHGDKDRTVPHDQSIKLTEALKKAGVSVEFITVKGGGHGMAAAQGDPPAEPDQKSLNASVRAFFDKHLKKR